MQMTDITSKPGGVTEEEIKAWCAEHRCHYVLNETEPGSMTICFRRLITEEDRTALEQLRARLPVGFELTYRYEVQA